MEWTETFDEEIISQYMVSSDHNRQFTALLKLVQIAANGRDISNHFAEIVEHGLEKQTARSVRLLSYNLLSFCSNTQLNQRWESLVDVIQRDLMHDDSELRVCALKAIIHLPEQMIQSGIVSSKFAFDDCITHNHPSVRKTTIETLRVLLLFNKAIDRLHESAEEFWNLITDRVLEDNDPTVFRTAFGALDELFGELLKESPVFSNRQHIAFPQKHSDSHHIGKRNVKFRFAFIANQISGKLMPQIPLLSDKLSFLRTSWRSSGLKTLTYLVLKLTESKSLAVENEEQLSNVDVRPTVLTYGDNVVQEVVQTHLLPLLRGMDECSVFEAGNCIIQLLWQVPLHQQRLVWAVEVIEIFVTLLQKDIVSSSSYRIVDAIIPLLHMLNYDYFVFVTIRLLLSIREYTELSDRFNAFLPICDLLITNHAKKYEQNVNTNTNRKITGSSQEVRERPISVLQLFFSIEWIRNAWKANNDPFREELLCCLIKSSFSLVRSKKSNWYSYSLDILELCIENLSWSCHDLKCQEQYLLFFDQVLHQREKSDSALETRTFEILGKVFEKVSTIQADTICIRAIYILCKYMPKEELIKEKYVPIMDIIRNRFLRLQTAKESKEIVHQTHKSGQLGADLAAHKGATPVQLHSALQCLFVLGARTNSTIVLPAIHASIDELLYYNSNDKLLQHECILLKRQLESYQSNNSPFADDSSSFSIHPDEAIELLPSFVGDQLEFSYNSIHNAPKVTPTFPQTLRLTPSFDMKLLSSPCDPLAVEASHTTNHKLKQINFTVRIKNISGVFLPFARVQLQLVGSIVFDHKTTQITRDLAPILPEEVIEFSSTLSVKSFALNEIHMKIFIPEVGIDMGYQVALSGPSVPISESNTSISLLQINCRPYQCHLNELLFPIIYSVNDFVREWHQSPALFQVKYQIPTPSVPAEHISRSLGTIPFAKVCDRRFDESDNFQFQYAATTWFGDKIFFTVIGSMNNWQKSHQHSSVELKVEFRCSSSATLAQLHNSIESCIPFFESCNVA